MSSHPRLLITGVTSIHGWPAWQAFAEILPHDNLRGIRPPKTSLPKDLRVEPICITDKKAITFFLGDFKPTHVIHCGGVCDLDVCEERPEWAQKLNTGGAESISELFGDSAYVLFMSTDLVFSGNNPPRGGYRENNEPNPISVAGKTFAEAERMIHRCRRWCIVRLGLPIGPSITGDKGGYDWINGRFERDLPVTLFYDEYRSVVSCDNIGKVAIEIIEKEPVGIFHFGGKEKASLYDVGRFVLQKGGYPEHLYNAISRHEEKDGPPRIGDVSLNIEKITALLGLEAIDRDPLNRF